MATTASHLLIARRYLERGFLDTAMDLLVRNASVAEADDWLRLSEALLERQRIADVVRVCEMGGVPLPRERLLALGDARLQGRDLDGAKLLYETADADLGRWERFLDVVTACPSRQRLAIAVAERHIVGGAGATAREELRAS